MHIYLSVPSVAFPQKGKDGCVIDTDLCPTYQCMLHTMYSSGHTYTQNMHLQNSDKHAHKCKYTKTHKGNIDV